MLPVWPGQQKEPPWSRSCTYRLHPASNFRRQGDTCVSKAGTSLHPLYPRTGGHTSGPLHRHSWHVPGRKLNISIYKVHVHGSLRMFYDVDMGRDVVSWFKSMWSVYTLFSGVVLRQMDRRHNDNIKLIWPYHNQYDFDCSDKILIRARTFIRAVVWNLPLSDKILFDVCEIYLNEETRTILSHVSPFMEWNIAIS